MIARIIEALRRCRLYALSIFLVYVLSSAVGIFMAHGSNTLALEQRDRIVKTALASDKSSIAHRSGDHVMAALFDAAGNLFFAAVPQTVLALAVIPPYFSVTYQGWVGGIVSVDGKHRSRFRSVRATSYYFIVLLLQFIPFSLCVGSGVRCGVELYRQNADVGWRFSRFRVPRQALVDVACAFAVAIPLFLIASAFEFLSPWNT
ncbi:MAG TPA: hypothetical protein VFK48_08530 [Usitatibacter sp.]|nr:hypothetical protein [Usitatibacter sp.]